MHRCHYCSAQSDETAAAANALAARQLERCAVLEQQLADAEARAQQSGGVATAQLEAEVQHLRWGFIATQMLNRSLMYITLVAAKTASFWPLLL